MTDEQFEKFLKEVRACRGMLTALVLVVALWFMLHHVTGLLHNPAFSAAQRQMETNGHLRELTAELKRLREAEERRALPPPVIVPLPNKKKP